jgi:hypothetical protein
MARRLLDPWRATQPSRHAPRNCRVTRDATVASRATLEFRCRPFVPGSLQVAQSRSVTIAAEGTLGRSKFAGESFRRRARKRLGIFLVIEIDDG